MLSAVAHLCVWMPAALHLAVCCNKLEVIPYLVSLPSIDVNPVDRFGNTPLDDARREGRMDLVSVLQV